MQEGRSRAGVGHGAAHRAAHLQKGLDVRRQALDVVLCEVPCHKASDLAARCQLGDKALAWTQCAQQEPPSLNQHVMLPKAQYPDMPSTRTWHGCHAAEFPVAMPTSASSSDTDS